MARYSLIQVILAHVSGFAEDNVVNTFSVESPDSWLPSLELGEVTIPIANFYNEVQPEGSSLASWISPGISRVAAAHEIRLFDVTDHLDGSPHGSPFQSDRFTMVANAAGTYLPEEVALALTLRTGDYADAPVEAPDGADANALPDRPRQRRTGKVYVGPFTASAATNVANKARPDLELQTVLLEAATALQAALQVGGHELCVWSRADAEFRHVEYVQVDNAWDTQRRRGSDATVRTTVAV